MAPHRTEPATKCGKGLTAVRRHCLNTLIRLFLLSTAYKKAQPLCLQIKRLLLGTEGYNNLGCKGVLFILCVAVIYVGTCLV